LLDVDVVITIDADTHLLPNALLHIRQAFSQEPQLVAACGVLTPRCEGGWLARVFGCFQYFEYLRAFLSRAAWMQSNALLLVSGALAAYRREMLITIGGYDARSLVEDYELIHRLHRHAHDNGLDWRVKVLPHVRAITDAPASFKAFLHQRKRWFAGFINTQFEYRAMHGQARYGTLGKTLLPIKAVDTLQPLYGMTAFILLCIFIASGAVFSPLIVLVIGVKLLIDFSYQMWAIWLYHRWIQQSIAPTTWLYAVFSTLAEPFSFQLLRHCGALWGWLILLTGHQDWVPQRTMSNSK
jgi:cellulose synthase/poly-beta-1,6-N-acetylglucosamine synthase-like glycosyltransferase